jgi:hypothetical protein
METNEQSDKIKDSIKVVGLKFCELGLLLLDANTPDEGRIALKTAEDFISQINGLDKWKSEFYSLYKEFHTLYNNGEIQDDQVELACFTIAKSWSQEGKRLANMAKLV